MNKSLLVSSENQGLRLDQLLSKHFPEHSRTYFQFLIQKRHILINDKPAKKQYRPSVGEKISIYFQPLPQLNISPEALPLDVLYEDEELLIINKPVGMVVHPAPGSPKGTFANALLYHCKTLNIKEFEALRPGIIHRLDKDTSGILLAAKTKAAHKDLSEQFSNRTVLKKYLAICYGLPKEGEFSAPIKRHPIKRQQMAVSPDGKEARSVLKTLRSNKGFSLVEVQLITGRTHQIRVHLQHLQCPILGDSVYGLSGLNQKYHVSRQLLHAYEIKFFHPQKKISLMFQAPLPNDMKNFIDQIPLEEVK